MDLLQKQKRKIVTPEARALIVDVYKFLKEEYLFTMRNKDCNCDLSHLRNISRRTADATNVSLRTVSQVLSEDRHMETKKKNKVYKFKKAKKSVAGISDAEAENLRQELELMETATLAEACEEEPSENLGILYGPIKVVTVVENTEVSWQPAEVKKEVEEEIHWKETEVKTEVKEEDINCKEAEVKTEIEEGKPILGEVDIKEEADDYEITIEEHPLG